MTCDLTIKRNQYIFQRYTDTDDLVSAVEPHLRSLVQLSKSTGVSIGILEAPPIFPKEWNRIRDCHDWEIQDDKPLNEQVQTINSLVQEINTDLGYRSPLFYQDFIKSRKSKNKAKVRYSLTSKLLVDGVHPNELTARKWLTQIVGSTGKSQ